MNLRFGLFVFLSVFCAAAVYPVSAGELSGYAAFEGRAFVKEPLYPQQERDSLSLALQPEYYHEWESGSSVTIVPFARLDSADENRSHFDVRELNYLRVGDNWELRLGIGKVFWGVTEFVHLADIINQTDGVESVSGEDKLGQPMMHLSLPRDWGVVDLFVLPYFRERTFPGEKGRLRAGIVVDTDNANYESGNEERNVDFAFRYSHTLGGLDFGIYHFSGTGREPTLQLGFGGGGEPVLVPYYEKINQTGADIQLVAGGWLMKLETIYRSGQGENFFAATGGFEYTFVRIAGTGADLGLIGEYAYDERGDKATTAFENDVMLGLRLSLNDAAGSELLAGMALDMEDSASAISLEGSRRFGGNWKASLEGRAFLKAPEDDILYSLRDDSFARLEIFYYY